MLGTTQTDISIPKVDESKQVFDGHVIMVTEIIVYCVWWNYCDCRC